MAILVLLFARRQQLELVGAEGGGRQAGFVEEVWLGRIGPAESYGGRLGHGIALHDVRVVLDGRLGLDELLVVARDGKVRKRFAPLRLPDRRQGI